MKPQGLPGLAQTLALVCLPLVAAMNGRAAAPPATKQGTVVVWGGNDFDQSKVPSDLNSVVAIAAGGLAFPHILVLKSDGIVVELLKGPFPVPSNLNHCAAIATGDDCLALKADGTVVAWGANSDAQSTVPNGLSSVAAIAAGLQHNLALKWDGTLVAWGYNHDGECNVPPGLSGVTAIGAGYAHSLALKADGKVVAWGRNELGQCNVPPGLNGVIAIAAGGYHSLALRTDGTIVAWGANFGGECDVPPGLGGVIAIAAGGVHSLSLKADGTVVAWGDNTDGQCDVPLGLSGVIAIAAGTMHSVALVAEPGPPPGTIQGTVVASPASALADGESAVTVTVTLHDGTGQPLAGKAVKVSALGTTMAVSITQPANPTDANGRATATLTSLTAGTVLIAATDVTDGIPLSQQSQQPLVTFTANLVPPNDDLRQAIASLFDDTVTGMKANAVVGKDAGNQGDAFRANLFADAAGVVLDALVGVVNLASGVSHSAKFAGLLAEPGLEETGAGALITDPAKLSYLFDTELIHGELTSRVLESVFRSVLATALKKGVTKLGVEGIKDGLGQIAAQNNGLSQVAEITGENVGLFEQSLQQRKEPLLSNGIPPLSTAQQTAWANDLDLRGETWLALANVLSQQDHFLQQFTAARATSSADAFEWFLQKLVVQATATVLFDGPGVLVTGGLFLVLDERQDLLNLSSDQTGYQIAFSTLGGVIQRNNELYLNAASAYTELAQARLATPVIGEVGQMSDLEEGHAWKLLGLVPKFSVAKAYSQVNIQNTSPGDATFEVFVLWGYASSAYNVSIPNLAQVSIGAARIPAQAEVPISVLYKNGSRGAEPDATTPMTVFVLGNNESGTFYVGRFTHDWSPTQTEAVGEAYARSGLYSSIRPMDDSGPTNALPAMENPVSIYVTQNAEAQTYQGRIFVVNPFGQSYYAIVTQALPTGATVLTTDGTVANSTIAWTNGIAAGGLVKNSFTFRLPLSPGAATNLPPAMVTFTDTVDTSEPLVSDEPGFTGLFPVKVTGSIPLGTPGTNATMLVTVTNLTAFAQSGTLTLTLTNAALAFGTNLAQPFVVTATNGTNLNFSFPGDVPPGQYAVAGLLSMNGGSGQVLAGVYTMPTLPFSLSLGPVPVWSTNGLSLALQGPVGSNYLIQASADLANWTPVRYFGITNSPTYFDDGTATNSGARFYRAVMP